MTEETNDRMLAMQKGKAREVCSRRSIAAAAPREGVASSSPDTAPRPLGRRGRLTPSDDSLDVVVQRKNLSEAVVCNLVVDFKVSNEDFLSYEGCGHVDNCRNDDRNSVHTSPSNLTTKNDEIVNTDNAERRKVDCYSRCS